MIVQISRYTSKVNTEGIVKTPCRDEIFPLHAETILCRGRWNLGNGTLLLLDLVSGDFAPQGPSSERTGSHQNEIPL